MKATIISTETVSPAGRVTAYPDNSHQVTGNGGKDKAQDYHQQNSG